MTIDMAQPLPARSVIIVDDDAALLHALTFAFMVEGFDARAYASGESLLAAGFNGYVEKPIRPQALLDAIHAALPPAARRTPESQRLIA